MARIDRGHDLRDEHAVAAEHDRIGMLRRQRAAAVLVAVDQLVKAVEPGHQDLGMDFGCARIHEVGRLVDRELGFRMLDASGMRRPIAHFAPGRSCASMASHQRTASIGACNVLPIKRSAAIRRRDLVQNFSRFSAGRFLRSSSPLTKPPMTSAIVET